jgi:hypothetical protein
MSYKMVSPNRVRIDWIPLAGLTTPASPKATELNAGNNISAAVETGYSLKFTDSKTDPSKTIVQEGNSETPTLKNYEGKLTFFEDEVGSGTQDAPEDATIFTEVVALFKVPYVEGWLVKRVGYKANLDYAALQQVSVFKFKNDQYRTLEGEPGDPTRIEVEFLKQGEAYYNVMTQA